MTIDLFASGRDPQDDYALTGPHPDDPDAIETFVVWLHDKHANAGVELRIHAKDGAAQGRAVVFLPDGRILEGGPEGAPIAAGNSPETEHVHYRCLQPFRHWTYRLSDFPTWTTSDEAHHRGDVVPGPSTTVSLEFDAIAAAPIWIQGALLPEARAVMDGPVGLWIAGRLTSGMTRSAFRYDQALAATGTITVDGDAIDFTGYGLRGHVRGVRIMEGFKSHTWMGAVFPDSGRSIGLQCHVRVWRPWRLGLTRFTGRDDRIAWTSMGDRGLGEAGSMPVATTYGIGPVRGRRDDAARLMSQALAGFEWDGERGYGMCERSG